MIEVDKMGIMMLKKFVKYVSQNMLGMVGMSVYILADTYFISVAVGTDGITALNLVLPVYNMIFAIGAMMGVGSAIRLVIERNQEHPNADGYFFHALSWALIVGLLFILVGIFFPDKLIALLGGDAEIVAVGKNYTRIFMSFAPFFMWNYICNAFVRNDGNPSIAMAATLFSSLFNIVFDYVLMFPLGLSMEGAALATALSPVVGILICCIHFRSEKCTVKFKPMPPSLRKILFCCQFGVSSFVGEISSGVITVAADPGHQLLEREDDLAEKLVRHGADERLVGGVDEERQVRHSRQLGIRAAREADGGKALALRLAHVVDDGLRFAAL